MKGKRKKEIRLQGTSLSEGIAIGSPFFMVFVQEEFIPEFPIAIGEVDQEIARYRSALFSSREDLELIQCNLEKEGSTEAVNIIDSHIEMLSDPLMTVHMEEKIRQRKQNTEAVFRAVITEYEKKFSKSSDLFFQERFNDVKDLSKRILRHLGKKSKKTFFEVPHNSVIIAKQLNPSDTASVQAERSVAIITEYGGKNSHTALIARAKGIPFVSGIDTTVLQKITETQIIVDGVKGEVILYPTLETLYTYAEMRSTLKTRYTFQEEDLRSPETKDGKPISVFANIGGVEDLSLMHQSGAQGAGLFRTEYLFTTQETLFSSEEEQFQIYKEVAEKMQGLPLVLRVFDIGADKYAELFEEFQFEANPILGCRGIRFLLRRKNIFKTQLRAILRASVYGNTKILLPFITDVTELLEAKKLIHEVAVELRKEGKKIGENIPLGAMIELPSAVFTANFILQHCDFLSIGTNDLVQYSLGVDRTCGSQDHIYHPVHPSILKMIKWVVREATYVQKPVTVCGEIASNPLLIPLLVGVGVQEFSCNPRFIPLIKKRLKEFTLVESQALAEKALNVATAAEIEALLNT